MFRLKNLIFASVLVLAIQVSAQSGWVDFMGRTEEAPPTPALLQSDNNTVSFTVQVNGMNRRDMKYQNQIYQRLSIPDCDRTEEEGLPEVPVITQLIAVPDCDDVMLSVMPSGELEFSGYHVCPAPRYERRESMDGSYIMEEVFEENASAYHMNSFYPQISGEIIETGYVREQKVVRVALYPVQFNPIRKELKVFTDFHVSLTFINPVSPVNKELGIFRNMMHHTALNYELSGISASTRGIISIHGNDVQKTNMVTSGSVNRVTNLNLLVGPSAMSVDYLIITHADLFNSDTLTLLANHRRDYNGFDVVIVQVDASGANNDIYDYYTPPTDTTKYISIRDFIADVYDNGKADHTYDGKLGYIVLVGDAYKDDNSTEMVPANYYYTGLEKAGDYYYACIDGDDLMDLIYGRLSVGNETELANIVSKTIAYEQSTSGSWRDNIAIMSFSPDKFSYGDEAARASTKYHIPESKYVSYAWRGYTGDTTKVTDPPVDDIFGQTFTEEGYDDPDSLCGAPEIKDWFFDDKINNPGQHIFVYFGHGGIFAWGAEGSGRNFRTDEMISRMSNSNKYPFIINCGCSTGKFDNKDETDPYRGGGYTDCISEVVMNIANKGAIGCLSSTRDSYANAFSAVAKKTLIAQFDDLSHVMGEAVMEMKLAGLGGVYKDIFRRQYNLYGDPAVNLWPYGFTLTEDIALSDTNYISTDITVNSGVTLHIYPGAYIVFTGDYSITVLDGGKIISEGSSLHPIHFTATTENPDFWKQIRVEGSDNSFKWCEFEYGEYPLYFYGYPNTGTDNMVKNCIFSDNKYGLRISNSDVTVSNCEMFSNTYYGVILYGGSDVQLTANIVRDNGSNGIHSGYGNSLAFERNVIKSNNGHGIHTQDSDVIKLGDAFAWEGYNTIWDNSSYGVRAYSGSPNVEAFQSSIHGNDGYEIWNYSGNPQVITFACWFGASPPSAGEFYGSVLRSSPLGSEPCWDGDTTTSCLGKSMVYDSDNQNVSDREQIPKLKNIVLTNPSSPEAVSALFELYAIVRPAFSTDRFEENSSFYLFLDEIVEEHSDLRIGQLALQYRIVWKMLEDDYKEVIKLSEDALKILKDEDRMCVLGDLIFTYAYTNQIDQARAYLGEYRAKYGFDQDMIAFLEAEISDAEEMIAKGLRPVENENKQMASVSETFGLSQNYPNPGNPTTNIVFSLAEPRRVELKIFNILGQEVRSLVNDYREAGAYSVIWDGKSNQGLEVPSGIYLYQLRAGEHVFVKKLTLLK